MTTLQDLYMDDPDSPEYAEARTAKVKEIAGYIRGHLSDPGLAESLAAQIMSTAESTLGIDDDDVYGEVSAKYTTTGQPLIFTI